MFSSLQISKNFSEMKVVVFVVVFFWRGGGEKVWFLVWLDMRLSCSLVIKILHEITEGSLFLELLGFKNKQIPTDVPDKFVYGLIPQVNMQDRFGQVMIQNLRVCCFKLIISEPRP